MELEAYIHKLLNDCHEIEVKIHSAVYNGMYKPETSLFYIVNYINVTVWYILGKIRKTNHSFNENMYETQDLIEENMCLRIR